MATQRLALNLMDSSTEVGSSSAHWLRPISFRSESLEFQWPDASHDLEEADTSDSAPQLAGWSSAGRAFVCTARARALDLRALEEFARQGPADSSANRSPLASVNIHTDTQADCLERCALDVDCLMYAQCNGRQLNCLLVSPIRPTSSDARQEAEAMRDSLAKLKSVFKPAQNSTDGHSTSLCDVYMRDHLLDYSKFEATFAPKSQEQKFDQLTAAECAALCHAAQTGPNRCLSFDVCQREIGSKGASGSGQEMVVGPDEMMVANPAQLTSCFLQASHVSLNSFEQTILLPASETEQRNTVDGKPVKCDHFSKMVSRANYKQIANRRLAKPMQAALRSDSLERCAIDCEQDDTCLAFEYCLNERRQPTQSCYLIRDTLPEVAQFIEFMQDDGQRAKLVAQQLGSLLKVSRTCSVYVARRRALDEKLNTILVEQNKRTKLNLLEAASLSIVQQRKSLLPKTSHYILVFSLYLLVALVAGTVIQVIYLRASSRRATPRGNWTQMT